MAWHPKRWPGGGAPGCTDSLSQDPSSQVLPEYQPFQHFLPPKCFLKREYSSKGTLLCRPKMSGQNFSSVQSLSRVQLFATPWTVALQASLSITNSWSLLKLMSIELVMPSNHLILCPPLLLLPSIFPSIRVFSKAYFYVIFLLSLKGHLKDTKIHLSFP